MLVIDRLLRRLEKLLYRVYTALYQYNTRRIVRNLPKRREYDPIELNHTVSFTAKEGRK